MTPFETKEQLELELHAITKWEKDQKDLWFWEKIGRLPFQFLDKLTPKAVQRKLGSLLDELGSYIQSGGKYLVSEKQVLKKLQSNYTEYCRQKGLTIDSDGMPKVQQPEYRLEDVKHLPLAVKDYTAKQMREDLKSVASIQGAATGIGGIFTLSIDIPAILGMSLKVIQDTAIAYGFDPNEKQERVFVVKCLQFVSSDIVGKQTILNELSRFDEMERSRETLSELQGWREAVIAFADNLGWKKLFQIVPIAGIAIGSIMNRSHIHDVAETAQMMYKKRAVQAQLKEHTDAEVGNQTNKVR